MDLNAKYTEIKTLLEDRGQARLLRFYDSLDDTAKAKLLDDISNIEWDSVDYWITNYVKNDFPMELPENFDPATSFPSSPKTDEMASVYEKAASFGKDLIAAGKVAAFVVAGGQGTRLGFDGPKGNFPITPVKEKTLFQIFAEKITAASRKYDAPITWYIMTSPMNYTETVEIFKENSYFGLFDDMVNIFQQGTMPNFDLEGNILLADKNSIACSPDGHGGSLKALYQSGAIEHMKSLGVEQISYFQVDNPLINIIDPLFIGLHATNFAQMSSKALKKTGPKEKVGNFCMVNDRVNVIEYSDLPDELAEKKYSDGSLMFELGSIAIHMISTSFVEKLNEKGFALPIHRAIKKIPHIDDSGNIVKPTDPNGVKLETFVFDALPLAQKSIILETLRENEFAPVKNASGTDSADVTRKMMCERDKKWLKAAGVNVPEGCIVEISPMFATCVEDVIAKKDQLPEFKANEKIYIE
jgi:UDP-N-acetylglucosamine/UDP-N-acetylgalactosamine diphosphorylase